LGNSSILGNRFLVDNPDYDFYMDISYRGSFSMRSNNRVDVAKDCWTYRKWRGT